jgi:hypothetical protein
MGNELVFVYSPYCRHMQPSSRSQTDYSITVTNRLTLLHKTASLTKLCLNPGDHYSQTIGRTELPATDAHDAADCFLANEKCAINNPEDNLPESGTNLQNESIARDDISQNDDKEIQNLDIL